jgi:hypothetical protein
MNRSDSYPIYLRLTARPSSSWSKTRSGRAAHLELDAEILATLLVLLPASGGRIVQRAQRERLIHRLADFQLVCSPNNDRLLTFETLDGLTMSFSLSDELSSELGHAHLAGGGDYIETH